MGYFGHPVHRALVPFGGYPFVVPSVYKNLRIHRFCRKNCVSHPPLSQYQGCSSGSHCSMTSILCVGEVQHWCLPTISCVINNDNKKNFRAKKLNKLEASRGRAPSHSAQRKNSPAGSSGQTCTEQHPQP
jgi:hypothetical protein